MRYEEVLSMDMSGNGVVLDEPKQLIPCMPALIIEPLVSLLDFNTPHYASEGDSGMDVYSRENYILKPGETKLFKLGFKMQIPKHPFHDLGYRWESQARPRSGVSLKTPIRVANAPGTIDNFYVNEVGVILTNAAFEQLQADCDYESVEQACGSPSFVSGVAIEQVTAPHVFGLDGKAVTSEELDELGLKSYGYERFPVGSVLIRKGDRIAQLVFAEIVRPMEIVVGKVDEANSRGGGFGSTGV